MSGKHYAHPAAFEGGLLQDEVIWLPPPVLNYVECRGDDGYGNQTGHRYTLTTVEGPLLRYRLTSVFIVDTDDELEDEPNDA